MSKRLSIIGTTALVAIALLGSAALFPALQKSAPAQSMETAALVLPLSAMQDVGSMMASGAKEAAGAVAEVLDYSFVFTGAQDDGTSGWDPLKFRTTVHSRTTTSSSIEASPAGPAAPNAVGPPSLLSLAIGNHVGQRLR